jgi:gliding motility-associated-like protein
VGSGGLMKIPPNGLLGDCLLPADTPVLAAITITTSQLQAQEIPETTTITNEAFTFIPQTVRASSFFCFAPDNCKTLKITGNTAVCDTSNPYVYQYQKSAGCTSIPVLSFSQDSVLLISNTSDSFTVKFLKPGQARIMAAFTQGCNPVFDTIFVNISAGIGAVNIGSDTALCANDTITLTATAGFFSYQWNTGATTPSIRTGTVGQYYVTALSACGVAYSDSLMISFRAFPPLLNHGDSIVCINSNVQLEAVTGYTRYEWRNNLGVISSNRVVTATVNQPQKWTIFADYFGLCPFMDSLSLNPFAPSIFSLGADSSLCEGQSLTLTAPTWLNTLQWSTGSTARSIMVNSSGTYRLTGLDTNACVSADTMVLMNVYINPVLELGASGSICAAPDYRLDAGIHSTYLWNDGSTDRYLPITSTGIYAVTVKSQQNCTASDTINITAIINLPQNFINDTASICRYQTTTLRAIGSYSGYLWSNGATTPSIVINQAGAYSLTVTNAGGCSATDSIVVSELTCIEGIYIPSAFTPNGDGRNDNFKPIVYTNVEQFTFMIFSRWGDLLFSTQTPGAGWDGTANGKAMPAGNFVWKLVYKEVGGVEVSKGGSVMLVR